MQKKIIVIADAHIASQRQLYILRAFLNYVKDEASRCDVSFYFLGNGAEVFCEPEDFIPIKEISDVVAAIPDSGIVRGNHDSDMFVVKPGYAKIFDFSSLNVYYSAGGILLTHNVATMVGLKRETDQKGVEVSDDDRLNIAILEEYGLYEKIDYYLKEENAGKIRDVLKQVAKKVIEKKEGNVRYLNAVSSMMAQHSERIAFVGHEHNIDLDTTTIFQLSDLCQWELLEAGNTVKLKYGERYVIVTPHFFGARKLRTGTWVGEDAHYLEFIPETLQVSYKKRLFQ